LTSLTSRIFVEPAIRRAAIQPGASAALGRGGIIEAANPSGDFFGEERFKACIRAHSHLPADSFADSLLRELAAWSGKKVGMAQEDDLTLIVIDIS